MKLIKRIIKIFGILLSLGLLGVVIYVYSSGPKLSSDTKNIIDSVLNNPLPEMIKGEIGIARSQDLDIWYERISPSVPSKGTILLIMGISNDALGWPLGFIQSFVDSGYSVIRYDHRGTGLSDWVEDWDPKMPYSLKDMAMDGISILDKLEIRKANVIGISMGGMIAQELAIHHSERVQSLTSMMSSGNIMDQELPPISSSIAYDLIKTALKYGLNGTESNIIKMHVTSRMILMGDANLNLNIKELSEQVLYNIRKRKGYNMDVSKQHQAAVSLSDSRYGKLKTMNIPTLIIHGQSDPFIPIEHSKKCVAIIPHADSLWVDNMGHDILDQHVQFISEKIINNFNRQLK